MKHLFVFHGIKAPTRKHIVKTLLKSHNLSVAETTKTTRSLYSEKEREYHYCGMEIYAKFKKGHYLKTDETFIQYLICTHSHWDSVDFIAKHILGQYLIEHPSKKNAIITAYSESENMWLNRSAILFQLGYKHKTDFKLLKSLCLAHKNSDEFFIKKAIGWALREYAKTNMEEVKEFVQTAKLKPLSTREALKHLK